MVSVLIFVTPKPDDNFYLAFLLTLMQKKFSVVQVPGAINPPPYLNAHFWIPTRIGLIDFFEVFPMIKTAIVNLI